MCDAGVTPDQFQSSGDAESVLQVLADITGVPPDNITVNFAQAAEAAPAAGGGSTGRKLMQQQVRHYRGTFGVPLSLQALCHMLAPDHAAAAASCTSSVPILLRRKLLGSAVCSCTAVSHTPCLSVVHAVKQAPSAAKPSTSVTFGLPTPDALQRLQASLSSSDSATPSLADRIASAGVEPPLSAVSFNNQPQQLQPAAPAAPTPASPSPTPADNSSGSSGGSNTGAIVGGVVGGVLGGLLLLFLVLALLMHKGVIRRPRCFRKSAQLHDIPPAVKQEQEQEHDQHHSKLLHKGPRFEGSSDDGHPTAAAAAADAGGPDSRDAVVSVHPASSKVCPATLKQGWNS